MPGILVMLVCALLLAGSDTAAHDFWIEPSSFRPEAGSKIDVRLAVGENFEGARNER